MSSKSCEVFLEIHLWTYFYSQMSENILQPIVNKLVYEFQMKFQSININFGRQMSKTKFTNFIPNSHMSAVLWLDE
jgi:hypothetical protein